MIYRDEETYQLFDDNQNKPESQEFEYKDSYWDEMEGMLDANDAKRKNRKGILFALSSVSFIALTFLGFSLFNSEEMGTSALVFDSKEHTTINTLAEDNSKFENKTNQVKENKLVPPTVSSNSIAQNSNSSSNSIVASKLTKEVAPSKNTNTVTEKKEINTVSDLTLTENTKDIDLNEKLIPLEKRGMNNLDQNYKLASINLENRKSKFKLMHSLSVNAEGGVANKYQSDAAITYAGMLGVGYELAFHKNLSFQTGANLIYRDGLAQTYKNETKVYGFESTRYYQDISYKGQFNIEIPVSLKVRLKRSSITAGVGTSFLLGVRTSVSQNMPESSAVETVKNNWGIKDGIRKMDVNLNLNYSYAVTTNMEVTAGISAGLLDQTDNQFFSSDEKNYNMQFRIGLKYFFFNK